MNWGSFPQVPAIGCNDLLVPKEAVLPGALQGTLSGVILVHIDEAVALGHLSGTEADHVNATPDGIPQDLDAVENNGLLHGPDVLPEIVDAIAVVDTSVRFSYIIGAKSVFHDEDRFFVPFIQHVQAIAQAGRIDLPSPIVFSLNRDLRCSLRPAR